MTNDHITIEALVSQFQESSDWLSVRFDSTDLLATLPIDAKMATSAPGPVIMTIADLKEAASRKMPEMVRGTRQMLRAFTKVLTKINRLLQWRLDG